MCIHFLFLKWNIFFPLTISSKQCYFQFDLVFTLKLECLELKRLFQADLGTQTQNMLWKARKRKLWLSQDNSLPSPITLFIKGLWLIFFTRVIISMCLSSYTIQLPACLINECIIHIPSLSFLFFFIISVPLSIVHTA